MLDEEERILGDRVAKIKERESEAKGEKTRWDKFERQFQKYSRDLDLLGQEEGNLMERRGEIESPLGEIEELERELVSYEGKDEELRRLKEEQRHLQREQVKKVKRNGLEQNIAVCTRRIEELGDELASLSRNLEAFETLDQRVEDHSGRMRRISGEQEKVVDALGRIRPLLESRTSQLLSLVTDGRYSVVELDEDYNIFIYDGNEKFRIQRFSGGEQDVFNLCLRIAISQIVADRSGGEINFIALDEIFGSQDVERRENILKIFTGLSSQFRQIFLITHIEEVKDMIPVVWSVEEVSEGLSTVIT